MSFFYSVLIARILGPELRGVYFLLQTYQSLAVILFSISIQTILTITLSREEFKINEVHTAAIILSIILGIISAIVGFFIFVQTNKSIPVFKPELILFFAISPFLLYKLFWGGIMLGLIEISVINWITIFDATLLLLLAIFFVGELKLSIDGLVLSFILNNVFVVLIEIIAINKKYKLKWEYSNKCIRELLNLGWKQHISIIAYNLYMRADAFILALFSTTVNIGYYSVAKGLVSNISIAVNPITQVMFPHISAAESEKSKFYTRVLIKSILLLTLIMSIIYLVLASPLIKLLYGDAYEASINHSQILVFAILFLLLQTPINLWFIGNLKKPLLPAYINLFTLFCVCLLGWGFTSILGNYGMSWALLVSFFLSTIFALILAKKNGLKVDYNIKKEDYLLLLHAIKPGKK